MKKTIQEQKYYHIPWMSLTPAAVLSLVLRASITTTSRRLVQAVHQLICGRSTDEEPEEEKMEEVVEKKKKDMKEDHVRRTKNFKTNGRIDPILIAAWLV
jgi:predicted Holliday junction resolvase-like endonuclease